MTSLTNKETIERLYAAFAERDGAAMTACYAPGAHFRDPAFGDLEGDDIGAMWRMLTGRARDLEITLREHEADERTGTAHWIARYTFSTGRRVENDIQAKFAFDEKALIADHVDDFDFHRWARQALGTSGLLLGWTPFLRNAVRRRARAGLDEYLAR